MLRKAANNLTAYLEKTSEFFTIFSLFPVLISICIVYLGAILYGVKVPPIILLLSLLTTFAVYNLNKVTDHTEDTINKPNKTTKKQLYFTIAAILCYLSVFIISIIEGTQVFLICLIPLITGFIYSVKISKSIRRLKEILYIKSITIAFSWAFPGALLPALTGTVAIEKIVMVFLYIFILLFINTVLFDIIDIPGDKAANIKTIPLQLGKQKTTRLLLLINSLLILWLITCLISGMFIKYLPVATFGILHSYGIIWYFTTKEKKRYHADILIDGVWVPIIILLLLTPH